VAQPGTPILTFRVDSSPSTLRIALRGELDLSCTELFDCLFDLEVMQGQAIVLDLSDLAFCDVVGVNALTGLRDYHHHRGHTVRLQHAVAHVARLIDLLETAERLIPTRRAACPGDRGDPPELR
jgi:anti-anti-sigma factor